MLLQSTQHQHTYGASPRCTYRDYYSYKASHAIGVFQGILNMCQAALDNKVDRFIHISTSEVCGNAQTVPINEHHSLQAQSP